MTYLGILETTDGVLHIQHDDKYIYYGSACNVGFLEHGRQEIDDCFSLDENLQALIEELEVIQ